MADFQDADINELLNAKEAPKMSEDEKAYQALLKSDETLINDFGSNRDKRTWPEPVRKRFAR